MSTSSVEAHSVWQGAVISAAYVNTMCGVIVTDKGKIQIIAWSDVKVMNSDFYSWIWLDDKYFGYCVVTSGAILSGVLSKVEVRVTHKKTMGRVQTTGLEFCSRHDISDWNNATNTMWLLSAVHLTVIMTFPVEILCLWSAEPFLQDQHLGPYSCYSFNDGENIELHNWCWNGTQTWTGIHPPLKVLTFIIIQIVVSTPPPSIMCASCLLAQFIKCSKPKANL